MKAKLVLSIESSLIQKAKKHAAMKQVSVSKLVEAYFALLGEQCKHEGSSLLPLTRALRGALKGILVNEDEYGAYLEGKYK